MQLKKFTPILWIKDLHMEGYIMGSDPFFTKNH